MIFVEFFKETNEKEMEMTHAIFRIIINKDKLLNFSLLLVTWNYNN